VQDLEHAIVGADERFIDAEFSIVHELLSVQTVSTDNSSHGQTTRPSIHTYIYMYIRPFMCLEKKIKNVPTWHQVVVLTPVTQYTRV